METIAKARAAAHNITRPITFRKQYQMIVLYLNQHPLGNALLTLHFSDTELKCSGGWGTGTVGWLSTSERGQYLEGWPAMNTKCLVPLPFLPVLKLWSTKNRSHGSPVLVPPETQQSGLDGEELDWLC